MEKREGREGGYEWMYVGCVCVKLGMLEKKIILIKTKTILNVNTG
jgi:hypothetical protein